MFDKIRKSLINRIETVKTKTCNKPRVNACNQKQNLFVECAEWSTL